MRLFASDHVPLPLPAGHRFPMEKYRLVRERLVAGGTVRPEDVSPSPPATRDELLAVHDAAWVDAVLEGTLAEDAVRRIGFPWSPALAARSLASVGGTVAATRTACAGGLSGQLAGGTHHAHRDFGAGYCVFNDLAVAARAAQAEGLARRVLVLDLDVHQGDGTAALFAGDPSVFTCSVHGARNFPARKTTSDLDVPLPDGTGDARYLEAVAAALAACADAARPDLVLYQAGVDGLASDRLGRLALTAGGLAARDRLVLDWVAARGLPCVLTLGGGYAEPIDDTVAAHAATFALAAARSRDGRRITRAPGRTPSLSRRTP